MITAAGSQGDTAAHGRGVAGSSQQRADPGGSRQPAEDCRVPSVPPGRSRASRSSLPGPDDLSPAQVESLLKQNRTPFNNFAQKLTDAALVALRAVDARSVEGLYEAGDVIDQACESCHLNYWYPEARLGRARKNPEVSSVLSGARSAASSASEQTAGLPQTSRRREHS